MSALRKWLNRQGGGGPQYAGAAAETPADHFAGIDRHKLLNREEQHTQNCAACSQAWACLCRVAAAFPCRWCREPFLTRERESWGREALTPAVCLRPVCAAAGKQLMTCST